MEYKMKYITENITIYDSEYGFNPLGLYALLLPSKKGEAALELKKLFKGVDFSKVEPIKAPDYVEFLEFLIDLVASNTPYGLNNLTEVDTVLGDKLPMYKGIKYVFNSIKRSIFISPQNSSPYASTSPLLLYALKKAGYAYMFWKPEDPLLAEYLGKELAPLVEFRKSAVLRGRFQSAIDIMVKKVEIGGAAHAWYFKKTYPNETPVKGQLSKNTGIKLTSTTVAVLINSWCNHNNPSNIGIAIYDCEDWDYVPTDVKPMDVIDYSPW